MNKKVTFLVVIGILFLVKIASADQWALPLNGSGADYANSIQQTADGGFIVAGYTNSFGGPDWDAWVVKLNKDGTVAWQKTYGGSGTDTANSIQQTADGGYIVAGSTDSAGAGNHDVWVVKLNADGTVAWQKTYGGSGADYAFSIQQTADGGYIVAGSTASSGAGNDDAWVLKLNADGSVAWQKTYGDSGYDRANSVQQTTDGGYIVAGYADSSDTGVGYDVWVLKLNADGTVAWERTYGGSSADQAFAVQQTADGGYIVAGYTDSSFGAGSHDALVLKLNADGTVAWQKAYGGSSADQAFAVQQTADGGYIVAGRTYSFGTGSGYDAWVLKLNADGSVAWQKTYGNVGHDEYASSIRQTADGGYIVAGYTDSVISGNTDAWVLKLDLEGNILGSCNIPQIMVSSATVANPLLLAVDTTATVFSTTVTPVASSAASADATFAATKSCFYPHLPLPYALKWQRTYGGSGIEYAAAVQQTSDGGYVAAGSTNFFGAGNNDAWVLKLNTDGAVAWQKTYGGTGTDVATAIEQTSDGGYIVAGWTNSFGAGGSDVWVLKLNTDGTVAWQKTYGGSGSNYASSVQQTADGGYIVAGGADGDAWVLKLNSDGTVAWQKAYGGPGTDYATSVRQTGDGGYIVAGYADASGSGNTDAWLLKLNSSGTVLWQKTYGGPEIDAVVSIQQTGDGGYIAAGYSDSFNPGSRDAWVLKLNASGSVLWQKAYGGPGEDFVSSIQQTADGGYIVAGYTSSFGAGNEDAWVLKLNGDGSVAWQKTYGGSGDEEAKSIQQTADGGYIVAGYTSSFGAGNGDVWVLKLDAEGGITGCAAIGTSNATPQSTNASVSSPSFSTQNTSVADVSSFAITSNTAVTPALQCFATYTQYLLDVFREGSGTGGVTSSPSVIDCGTSCQGLFTHGDPVTLTATADPGSQFAGWEGACDTNGLVTMDADKYCSALFNSIVDFSGTYRSGLAPRWVVFADISSNSPTAWSWDFGDGTTSAVQNPNHRYLFPGTYSVKLTATGPGGPGSITKIDYITANCGSGSYPVRFGTPPSTWSPRATIQNAYNAASDGNYIEPMSMTFSGDLSFDQIKNVTLKGGFDCFYSSNAALTTIIGMMTIGGPGSGTGCVTIENIIIR